MDMQHGQAACPFFMSMLHVHSVFVRIHLYIDKTMVCVNFRVHKQKNILEPLQTLE
jgi:hypothetical protein